MAVCYDSNTKLIHTLSLICIKKTVNFFLTSVPLIVFETEINELVHEATQQRLPAHIYGFRKHYRCARHCLAFKNFTAGCIHQYLFSSFSPSDLARTVNCQLHLKTGIFWRTGRNLKSYTTARKSKSL